MFQFFIDLLFKKATLLKSLTINKKNWNIYRRNFFNHPNPEAAFVIHWTSHKKVLLNTVYVVRWSIGLKHSCPLSLDNEPMSTSTCLPKSLSWRHPRTSPKPEKCHRAKLKTRQAENLRFLMLKIFFFFVICETACSINREPTAALKKKSRAFRVFSFAQRVHWHSCSLPSCFAFNIEKVFFFVYHVVLLWWLWRCVAIKNLFQSSSTGERRSRSEMCPVLVFLEKQWWKRNCRKPQEWNVKVNQHRRLPQTLIGFGLRWHE